MAQDDALAPLGLTLTHNAFVKAYLDSGMPITVLTCDVLLAMGQGGLKAYFNGKDTPSDRLQQIPRLWQNLLATTRSLVVTDRHLTAACNAMCVFLECACSSSLSHVRDFGMSKEVWLQCFGAVLESFEEGKAKPMRQVLITLAGILTRHPDRVVSISIQKEVITQMTGIVLLGEAGRMKAALVAIELFIRKVSSFDDVLQSIKYCVRAQRVEWSRRLASFGVEKAVDHLRISASVSGVPSTESDSRATVAFIVALLMALLSRDTQSAAIALYKTYSTALIASGRGNHLYSMSASKQEEMSESGIDGNVKRSGQSAWIYLARTFLEAHPAAVTPFTDFLFPTVFKHDPSGYREYANTLQKGDCNLINLLAVVQVGCQMGLERDPALTLTRTIRGSDLHSNQGDGIYGALLSHAQVDVRIRTFTLLLASPSTTLPLSNAVLQCLTVHMKYLYGDSDPQSRSEVLSIVRKLVIRLQGGAFSLHKSMNNTAGEPETEASGSPFTDLHQHEKFVIWFAKFLEEELRPDLSYQRHIMALKSVDLLAQSGLDSVIGTRLSTEISQDQTPWPITISLRHPSLTRALLNLVVDPFEDVRAASLKSLEILSPAVPLQMQKSICETVRRAEELASMTSRADHADGAARLYKLHYSLMSDSSPTGVASALRSKRAIIEEILLPTQTALASIEGELEVPLQKISLHTRLLSLRYIVQEENIAGGACEDEALIFLDWETLIGRMIGLCQLVWQKVRAPLCVDSPENEYDEVSEEVSAGSKDLLSYSWRALRDSSRLVCAILDAPIFQGRGAPSHSSFKIFESIGFLCMDQLSNLRHRGAFSTVAHTFFALCGRIEMSNDDSVAKLRDVWYENAVATIDQQADRLTRRSAGLPAMMVGLLNDCPQPFFDRFIESFNRRSRIANNLSERLSKRDGEQTELPQVHALNCLREVFTNAKFRIITEPHVMSMLNLAATSLSCDVWPIRNCGLMLFRACTNRLGRARASLFTAQNASPLWTSETIVSNDRAPDVLELAISLLDPGCFSQQGNQIPATLQSKSNTVIRNYATKGPVAAERVFAALDLVGRISPSFQDADRIESLVLGSLSSTVWQVREQAARVLVSRVMPWDAFSLLARLAKEIAVSRKQNTIHGRLLCIKQILRSLWRSRAEPLFHHLGRAAAILKPLATRIMADDMSSVIRTTFLDIVNDAFEIEILSRTSDISSHLACWIGDGTFKSTDIWGRPEAQSTALHEAFQFFSTISGPEQHMASTTKLRHLFLNLAKVDFDAADRFLARIASHDSWNQKIRNVIDDLYQFIIPNDFFPEDIKSKAMAGLTASIEHRQFNYEDFGGLTEISQCLLYDIKPRGRDLRNSKLRLQANLFYLGSPEALTVVSPKGHSDLYLWIVMLQDAVRDDMDILTRLNAASSLLALTPVLLSDQPALTASSEYLQIYLLLCDLLNDDDDDVREIAASAASIILSSGGIGSTALMKQSPLAATEKLASFLVDKFRHEHHFRLAALNRIWFSSTVAEMKGNVEQQITKCSIKALLENLQRDSSALFEEERQNLYIDDIREVEIWSKMLKSTEPPEESCLNSHRDWVLTGLRDLKGYLINQVDFDGPLGLTSQPEVLTLFVRVIELAGVTLEWAGRQPDRIHRARSTGSSDIAASPLPIDVQDRLDEASPIHHSTTSILLELKALSEVGRRLCIHERIMRGIEEVIKTNDFRSVCQGV